MEEELNKKEKFRNIGEKLGEGIDSKVLLFKVFDEPRPKYIAKITLIDKFLDKILLWIFPKSIRPNVITVFRFVSIPFIIILLLNNDYLTAFILFIIAAISDAVDGAMARTRNQITDWGIVFDPFADKLLIGIVGGILIFKFLSPALASIIICIELMLVASAYYRFKGEVVPAKTVGKIKMFLECIGIGFIFLFILTNSGVFLMIAAYILYVAILFALMSILIYRSI